MLKNCNKCGLSHNINQSPAFGKICYKCNKNNHFNKVCRSTQKRVNIIKAVENSQEDNDGDFFFGHVGSEILQEFTVKDTKLKIKRDTGAACNVIGSQVFKHLNLKAFEVLSCNKKVIQLDGRPVPVKGSCWLEIVHLNNKNIQLNS